MAGALYSVGDPWHARLPEGDSFGLYWQENGGLFLLGAVVNMRTPELAGLRGGDIRMHFGLTPGRQIAAAFFIDGFGSIDCVLGNVSANDYPPEQGAIGAQRWATGGGHGTVTGVFVDRAQDIEISSPARHVVQAVAATSTVDTIAALRYFTLSRQATAYVGRQLLRLFKGPVFDESAFTHDVVQFQRANPDLKRWARSSAVTCKAGD